MNGPSGRTIQKIEALMADGCERTTQEIADGVGVAYVSVTYSLRLMATDGVLVMRKRPGRNPGKPGGMIEKVYKLASSLDCTVQEWIDNADDDDLMYRRPVDLDSIRAAAMGSRIPLEVAWLGR